jgi:hypothetical protein
MREACDERRPQSDQQQDQGDARELSKGRLRRLHHSVPPYQRSRTESAWRRLRKNGSAGTRVAMNEISAAEEIDEKIRSLGDWRGRTLGELRALIRDADPEVVEAVKWRKPSNPLGVPVWEHAGIVCTGEIYKDKVKLTFTSGAALDDPASLFNASLDGGTRRAIDIRQGEDVNAAAFKALVRSAVAFNRRRNRG